MEMIYIFSINRPYCKIYEYKNQLRVKSNVNSIILGRMSGVLLSIASEKMAKERNIPYTTAYQCLLETIVEVENQEIAKNI